VGDTRITNGTDKKCTQNLVGKSEETSMVREVASEDASFLEYNETTRRCIPEIYNVHTCRRENVKSHRWLLPSQKVLYSAVLFHYNIKLLY
jgi:hypothetical protein